MGNNTATYRGQMQEHLCCTIPFSVCDGSFWNDRSAFVLVLNMPMSSLALFPPKVGL